MYPFIISVPHGGITIPEEVRDRIALSPEKVTFYSDPGTREIYDLRSRIAAFIDTPVSRVVVDLNHPPYHMAPKYPDDAIKSMTGFGTPVYRNDRFPDINLVHRLMVKYFFPTKRRSTGLPMNTRQGLDLIAIVCSQKRYQTGMKRERCGHLSV